MTKSNRTSLRSIAVGAALVAAAGAWYLHRRGDGGSPGDADAARGADPALLVDRVWVDSRPEKYTDYTNAMLVVGGAPIGVFQKASAYQATIELFEYKRRDAGLAVHFPQSGKKRQTRFRIHECKDLPPFDLCLDLADNPWGGPRRYYAMMDSEAERAQLGDLRHELEHRLADAGAAGHHPANRDGVAP
jgi:hypothetical protein